MKTIIAGNWKMNNLKKDIDLFVEEFHKEQETINFDKKDVLIAPPSIYFTYFRKKIKDNNLTLQLGLQNCHFEEKGAFTGEISPKMLKDIKADFVIIGHSERRHVFNESDEFINKKVISCLAEGIKTVFCIGETLEERDKGATFSVLERQLKKGLQGIENVNKLVVAYEPVWAIGTGKTATISQISEVHTFLKDFLEKNIANNIPLLYGGSVKPENALNILSLDNVNGVLVGGASLQMEQFKKIINFDKE